MSSLAPPDPLSKLATASLLAGGAPLLRATRLSKSYIMGRAPLRVLDDCHLSIRAGEFVAIMGKSGSGKSTLLHLLGALDLPDSGQVHFEGEPIYSDDEAAGDPAADRQLNRVLRIGGCAALGLIGAGLAVAALALGAGWQSVWTWLLLVASGGALAAAIGLPVVTNYRRELRRVGLRRRRFGFVFQFYHLLPELNVLENTLMTRMIGCPSWRWWFGERRRARVDALAILTRVGLAERLRHRPNQLSGGERQRVAIARALIHRPAVLFADEPTGNLDAAAGRQLMELLLELNRDGQTIVMVTHDAGVAALAHRVLRLEEGKLVND